MSDLEKLFFKIDKQVEETKGQGLYFTGQRNYHFGKESSHSDFRQQQYLRKLSGNLPSFKRELCRRNV